MRRNLIHLALAVMLVPATVALVVGRIPEPKSNIQAIPKPPHRVAMALEEALKAELATVVPGLFEIGYPALGMPLGTTSQYTLPEDSSNFWDTITYSPPVTSGPPAGPTTGIILSNLSEASFDGTTRDGRSVKVTVKIDPFGKGCLVDYHGDEALAKVVAPRVADLLAHPKHKHESPEDRAAITAFTNRGAMPSAFSTAIPAPIMPPPPPASELSESEPVDQGVPDPR